MKKDKLFKISIIMYVIPFLLGIIFYKQMPENLPVHFDMNGNPNSFQSKNIAVFGLPIFMLLVEIFVYFLSQKDPRKQYQGSQIINIMLVFMPLITTGIIIHIICYSLGFRYDIVKISNIIMAILFIAIGNYLPKTKRNYTVGFRTPWSLESDENWNKTNKTAGKLWVICGIAMLCLLIFGIKNLYIMTGILTGMVVMPILYSYLIYKKVSK